MSGFGASGPESFIKDPPFARLVCEVLADCAADGPTSCRYPRRKAYQALRDLGPTELYRIYQVHRYEGTDAFRKQFGEIYYGRTGTERVGPLFKEARL